ncbi:sulfate ABC transporter substrate-binding protein [Nostoc sp. FACHB-110]|uniref:sulfate ABC transporter substrate-binding protein n=1 Tax=Nostoc sp. FACHB-110 TaxID=2692834 RepID=UPI001686806F|nr:sulfate ABC transporter substrate-binding protein [Nostoc sp. FACHB-110]MBD2438095.1 sulfate ABC transporter substrate-binding protein [Nostoc sp. FACHB-110]
MKFNKHITKQVRTRIVKSWQATRNWGLIFLFLLGISLSLVVTACTSVNVAKTDSSVANSGGDVNLTFVSYSVTKAAYEQIIPQFIEKWKQEHNQNLKFTESYDGSGSQALNVIDGLEADVVHLSLALDVEKLVQTGFIQPGWEKEAPNNAIVTQSVGAIATREGNPKNIQTWADLTKPGVKVLTANPKTSGGARWNFLGLWGYVTKTGKDENQALDFTTKVYQNVPVLPKTARNATELFFKQGEGDALLNYENEMILSKQKGEKFSYIVPDVNISIENPIAIVDKNVEQHKNREVAEAFVQYLYTPEVQREFAKIGFRPVNTAIAQEVSSTFPQIKTLFKAEDLGGWNQIQQRFFNEGAIFDKIQALKSSK